MTERAKKGKLEVSGNLEHAIIAIEKTTVLNPLQKRYAKKHAMFLAGKRPKPQDTDRDSRGEVVTVPDTDKVIAFVENMN